MTRSFNTVKTYYLFEIAGCLHAECYFLGILVLCNVNPPEHIIISYSTVDLGNLSVMLQKMGHSGGKLV